MILLGYVTNHRAECFNPTCPLNTTDKELYLPLTNKATTMEKSTIKDPIILSHLLNAIYAEYSKSPKSAATLHIVYSCYLFYRMGNIHMALVELNLASKCETTMQ